MSPRAWTAVVAVLLGTCGVAQALPQNVAHAYAFKTDYKDQIVVKPVNAAAYAAAVPLGGSLDGAGNYQFAAGDGLALRAEVVQRGTYTIEMRVAPSEVTGYRRLIDFKNKEDNSGLYIFNGAAVFLPDHTGINNTAFSANTFADVVITRYGATGIVSVYVDGVEQLTFDDHVRRDAVFALSFPAQFFQDDSPTSGEETGGLLDYLRVWKQSLSAKKVRDLAKGQVPRNVIES